MQISKSDLSSKGVIRPIGARNFAEKQRRAQELTTLIQIKQDPSIGAHISGKTIAKMLAEEIGREELYQENIGMKEQMEMQMAAQDMEADMMEEMQLKAEMGE